MNSSNELLQYLGTETPYFCRSYLTTPIPKGYHVAFLNHIGRHGSRYLTSSKPFDFLIEYFTREASVHNLSNIGQQLLTSLKQLDSLYKGHYGLLTPLGVQEQKQIAYRMYYHYPEVFSGKIYASSSKTTRCIQSMDSFLLECTKWTHPSQINRHINSCIDPTLDFFDCNKEYQNYKMHGDWLSIFAQFTSRNNPNNALESYLKKAPATSSFTYYAVSSALYSIYANTFNIQSSSLLDIYNTCDLPFLWENENARQFLEKGPSFRGILLPLTIAYPLLEDFILTSDYALEQKYISACFRFAHAETIIPFAGLLHLFLCVTAISDCNLIANIWRDSSISPMSANIQWVFYTHPNKPTLLKCLLNEQETYLPLYSDMAPYYEWNTVKQYYEDFLSILPIPQEVSLEESIRMYSINAQPLSKL